MVCPFPVVIVKLKDYGMSRNLWSILLYGLKRYKGRQPLDWQGIAPQMLNIEHLFTYASVKKMMMSTTLRTYKTH